MNVIKKTMSYFSPMRLAKIRKMDIDFTLSTQVNWYSFLGCNWALYFKM